jgi:hypothetical protein
MATDREGAAKHVEEKTIMVFLRDTERGFGTGYKTKGHWVDGVFDATLWATGEKRCDAVRGPLLYLSGDFAAGTTRFAIERIVVWETGETVYTETGAA